MKTSKLLLSIMLALFVSINLSAQTQAKSDKTKTESIKVQGNCDMCKARIEKAAKTEGVISASWDSKTDLLTLNYDPSKTSTDAVAKKVAAVGHDTEKYKAEDKVYNALPGCCKYDRTGQAPAAEHSHTH
ncbi:MAG TPA: cation transporter [Bacteroidales bacterium]|nr:cation transporter [Bacteroidales bacterium]